MTINSLQEIYSKVPKVNCQCCGECCGPVMLSTAPLEKQVIKEYCSRNGILLKDFFDLVKTMLNFKVGYWQCPLFKDNKCLIYEVRPLICRLQGTVQGLPCPHDKNRKYPLTDVYVKRLIQKTWRASK